MFRQGEVEFPQFLLEIRALAEEARDTQAQYLPQYKMVQTHACLPN